MDDPGLGPVRVSTAEDLLLAKLEFAEGDLGGQQGRDIARLPASSWERFDQVYVRRHARGPAVSGLLEEALRRAGL